ncbi:hypothetical protein [Streptomyces sp. NPDC053431]|uniref:hypothetical protein n=1 Tax=Streptomyces sp. NPDC053431 TaxID=3365703 RepID=UPI0037D93478
MSVSQHGTAAQPPALELANSTHRSGAPLHTRAPIALTSVFVPAKALGKPIEDDGRVLVKVEAVQPARSGRPLFVRVRSAVGTAVVLWQGTPQAVGREHHVEWTVDEDIVWTENARPSTDGRSELWEDGDRIVMRGRLSLDEDGGASLDVGGSVILFDRAASPLPDGVDGSWVEVRVAPDNVTVWPYEV